MREIHLGLNPTVHTGSLASFLALLDPYWSPTKTLLVETAGEWTAVFSNGHDTYEASILSGQMRVRGVVTDFSVDLVDEGDVRNCGNVLFELCDRGKSLRTVQVSRQTSGWDAILLGSPQPFEQPDRYQARVKRERFDLEMLNRYCAALGIKRDEDGFYGPRALLHTESGTAEAHPHIGKAAAWRAHHLELG